MLIENSFKGYNKPHASFYIKDSMRVVYLVLAIIFLTIQGCATNPGQTSSQDTTAKPTNSPFNFGGLFSNNSTGAGKKSETEFNLGKLLSGNDKSSGDVNYGLFYDQGDHLKELVSERKFKKAASLFSQYKSEFFESESFLLVASFFKTLPFIVTS
jgi:hypothetical protein